jgi:hypothetical protein
MLVWLILMHVVKVTVPDEFVKQFPKVNWDYVAERALKEEFRRLSMMKMLNDLFGESEFTETDAMELGKKVNKGLVKRHTT